MTDEQRVSRALLSVEGAELLYLNDACFHATVKAVQSAERYGHDALTVLANAVAHLCRERMATQMAEVDRMERDVRIGARRRTAPIEAAPAPRDERDALEAIMAKADSALRRRTMFFQDERELQALHDIAMAARDALAPSPGPSERDALRTALSEAAIHFSEAANIARRDWQDDEAARTFEAYRDSARALLSVAAPRPAPQIHDEAPASMPDIDRCGCRVVIWTMPNQHPDAVSVYRLGGIAFWPKIDYCERHARPAPPAEGLTVGREAQPDAGREDWRALADMFHEISEVERLAAMSRWEREAERFKASGDMYGWNFTKGMVSGANETDIMFQRLGRALRSALSRTAPHPSPPAGDEGR